MNKSPRLRFLSLFVPDLADATARYREVFDVEPTDDPEGAPRGHPFASAGPVVFDLGGVALALYQCDMRATHPGDVGIGIEVGSSLEQTAARARAASGKVFYGPRAISNEDERHMAVFVLPDHHFFEITDGE